MEREREKKRGGEREGKGAGEMEWKRVRVWVRRGALYGVDQKRSIVGCGSEEEHCIDRSTVSTGALYRH